MIENYLSFKDRAVLNFQAGSIKEYKENLISRSSHPNDPLLKSIGLFGHNASGKSNLIKAISFMREFVLNSSKESNSSQKIDVDPFLLSTVSEKIASTFEMTFLLEERQYRYGFCVTRSNVESEWLFFTEKKKEEKVFVRAGQNYSFEKTFKIAIRGKFELFAEVTRTNSLFLSVLAQFNGDLAVKISEWFNELIIAHDIAHDNLIDFTAGLMPTADYRKLINDIVRRSDLGIEKVQEKIKDGAAPKSSIRDFITSTKAESEKSFTIMTSHKKYDENDNEKEEVLFDLLKNESLGTQKFFGILGPILLSLKKKKIIFIDEIDARLHSMLFEEIISLFNSNTFNPNGAQLVFTSHNTNILKQGLRRDQMYFVEKDSLGRSSADSIYSKDPKVRNDASFDKDYLSGKYGAIPRISSQLNLFDQAE